MENLLENCLEEIFTYLDVPALRSMMAVSNRFYSIIENSSKIGWRHPITVTNQRNAPSKVDIPIPGLRYKHLIIRNHSTALDDNMSVTFQEVFEELKPYLKSIKKATFDNFASNNHVNLRLCHINHLVIFQRDELSPSFMGKHLEWNVFEDLKKLEVDVDSIHAEENVCTAFGWLIGVELTHVKFYLRKPVKDEIHDEFALYLLDHQTFTIQELKLRGIKISHCPMETVVFTSENLRTMELELDELKDEDLLETIKSPIKYGYYTAWVDWNELLFKNVDKAHARVVNQILSNYQDIVALKLEYEQPKENNFIADVPNLKKIHYKFEHVMNRSFEDLSAVHYLEVHRVDNDAQMTKLIEFLNRCTSLKALKLGRISSRTHLTSRTVKSLLTAAKNLEQLHFDAYSDGLEISSESFELIKNEGKKLKKFVLSVDEGKVQSFRDQMKIFTNTQIRAITIGKVITPTCLETAEENLRIEPAVCVWKK